jgi:hypothetical protein
MTTMDAPASSTRAPSTSSGWPDEDLGFHFEARALEDGALRSQAPFSVSRFFCPTVMTSIFEVENSLIAGDMIDHALARGAAIIGDDRRGRSA